MHTICGREIQDSSESFISTEMRGCIMTWVWVRVDFPTPESTPAQDAVCRPAVKFCKRSDDLGKRSDDPCQRSNKGFVENTWLVLFFQISSKFNAKHNATNVKHQGTRTSQIFNFHLLSRISASRIRRRTLATFLSLSMVFRCGSSTPRSLKHCMSPNISTYNRYLYQWVFSPLKSVYPWTKSINYSQYLWLR